MTAMRSSWVVCRRDFSQEKTLNMWVVADNIRKGAATNAVQIAEYMISAGLLK